MKDEGELGYVSTSDDITVEDAVDGVNVQDEQDLPIMKQVLLLLDREANSFEMSVKKLDITDKVFTIEQQIAMNQEMAARCRLLRKMIDGVVNGIEEKYKS